MCARCVLNWRGPPEGIFRWLAFHFTPLLVQFSRVAFDWRCDLISFMRPKLLYTKRSVCFVCFSRFNVPRELQLQLEDVQRERNVLPRKLHWGMLRGRSRQLRRLQERLLEWKVHFQVPIQHLRGKI